LIGANVGIKPGLVLELGYSQYILQESQKSSCNKILEKGCYWEYLTALAKLKIILVLVGILQTCNTLLKHIR